VGAGQGVLPPLSGVRAGRFETRVLRCCASPHLPKRESQAQEERLEFFPLFEKHRMLGMIEFELTASD
jgi:hypothetical protein